MNMYKVARKMINDHLLFQHTAEYDEWERAGMPAWQYRRISLGGRRRLGFTTAATKLALDYWPSLIIIPSEPLVRHVAETMLRTTSLFDDKGRQSTIKGLPINDVVVSAPRLERFLEIRTPISTSPYKLAIIDEAFLVEQAVGRRKMDELRTRLFSYANLLVEFQ